MMTLCESNLPRAIESVPQKGWDVMPSTEEGTPLRATRQDVVSAWVFYACLLIVLALIAIAFDVRGSVADRDNPAAYLEQPVPTIDAR